MAFGQNAGGIRDIQLGGAAIGINRVATHYHAFNGAIRRVEYKRAQRVMGMAASWLADRGEYRKPSAKRAAFQAKRSRSLGFRIAWRGTGDAAIGIQHPLSPSINRIILGQ